MALKFKCVECGEYIITRFLKVGEVAKCQNCGAETTVPEDAIETDEKPKLQQAQPSHVEGPARRSVPNYLAQAILVTLFCCLPFGIVAIVYAAQVNSKVALGDYAGAMETSNKAKTWCWVSFGVGLGIAAIYVLALLLAGLSGV